MGLKGLGNKCLGMRVGAEFRVHGLGMRLLASHVSGR